MYISKSEGMWEIAVMAHFEVLHCMFLEQLKKTNMSQNMQSPGKI
jgi:hypothetical protein